MSGDRDTLLRAWDHLSPDQQRYVICGLHSGLPEMTRYLITKMLTQSTRLEAVIAASMAEEAP